MEEIDNLDRWDINEALRNFTNLYQVRDDNRAGRESSLMKIYLPFRDRRTMDPRDKTFGLLGICHDMGESLVDYSHSMASIHETVITWKGSNHCLWQPDCFEQQAPWVLHGGSPPPQRPD